MRKIAFVILVIAFGQSISATVHNWEPGTTQTVWGGPAKYTWNGTSGRLSCPGPILVECYKTTPIIPGLMLIPTQDGPVEAQLIGDKMPLDENGVLIGEIGFTLVTEDSK